MKDPKFHAAAVKRIEAARQQYELLPRVARPKQSKLDLGSGPHAPVAEATDATPKAQGE